MNTLLDDLKKKLVMINVILLEDSTDRLVNVPGKRFRCGGLVNIRREEAVEREFRGRVLVIQ